MVLRLESFHILSLSFYNGFLGTQKTHHSYISSIYVKLFATHGEAPEIKWSIKQVLPLLSWNPQSGGWDQWYIKIRLQTMINTMEAESATLTELQIGILKEGREVFSEKLILKFRGIRFLFPFIATSIWQWQSPLDTRRPSPQWERKAAPASFFS